MVDGSFTTITPVRRNDAVEDLSFASLPVGVDDSQTNAVSNTGRDHTPLAVVLPAILHLERGAIKDERRKFEIESPFAKVRIALGRVPLEAHK